VAAATIGNHAHGEESRSLAHAAFSANAFTSFLTRRLSVAQTRRTKVALSREFDSKRDPRPGSSQRTRIPCRLFEESGLFAGSLMGRGQGSNLRPLGLKVRPNELQQAAANGNVLPFARIATATSCNTMQGTETSLYAHSYARFVSEQTTAGASSRRQAAAEQVERGGFLAIGRGASVRGRCGGRCRGRAGRGRRG
jgi:hypothetical protein